MVAWGGLPRLLGTQFPNEYYAPSAIGGLGAWEQQSSINWHTSRFGAAKVGDPGGQLYEVAGDFRSTRITDVYDVRWDSWASLTVPLTTHRRSAGASTARDGRLYAIGGLDWRHLDDPPVEDVLASTEALEVGPNNCPPPPPPPADFDGNGSTDVSVFRPSGDTWFVKDGLAAGWGAEGDIPVPVPGDYDEDGEADLAVFRDGTWFTLPSSGGDYMAATYGSPGEIPVPGDYDADRTTDRAVFRPSDGTWSLHRSSDNADEFFAFGSSGDIPVPGDYNGDWTWDPALFRPSTGEWSVETGETYSWGVSTDIPLPLPYAVRKALF